LDALSLPSLFVPPLLESDLNMSNLLI